MKVAWTSAIAFAVLAGLTALSAKAVVRDDAIGLSKTSVFDVPSPDAFAYSDKAPNKSSALPRAYAGVPPQIPHSINGLLPITTDDNSCLGCHDKPALMGKKTEGIPTTMPESHYTKVDGKWQRNNSWYVCTQCHAPQANVKDLVGNTFKAE
ncbi:MAG TPA: nitrate reductase cytochrome c-type subunit [Thiobacillaceae bacterium]|nr:nitrate reductase cytochrome c-type subunit [Thiobacillaceae bacterium]